MTLTYVIVAPLDSDLSDESISLTFDKWISIAPDNAWVVSTDHQTCGDVRDALRERSEKASCVIFLVTEYNGFASRDLWEKLGVWKGDG